MQITKVHSVNTEDTKKIRQALKNVGLKVSHCKLGSNRYYILVETSDNIQALPVIESLGYSLDSIWRNTLENHPGLFQNDNMMVRKETIVKEA